MNLIDRVILEWSYKTKKGYPDLNNEEDLRVFESLFGFDLKEGDTSAAFEMEKVIVDAANGKEEKSELIPNSVEVGKKIVSSLNLNGPGKFPANTYQASEEWNSYFPDGAKGSTLTPKTDIVVGDKRISVKTGAAQLMSGGRSEAMATFYTAAKKVPKDEFIDELGKKLEGLLPTTDLTKLGIKGNKGELQKAGQFAKVEVLKKADEAHKAFKVELRNLFNNNDAFAREFTYEAMTGETKFGGSEGTADYFLVTDYEGNAKGHTVNSSSDEYVAKISKQVKPDVKFKSSQKTKASAKTADNPQGKTGFYSFWSTVGLGIDMAVNEAIENIDSKEFLTENKFDIVKWFKSTVKKAFDKIKEVFSNIKSNLVKSWKNTFDYLDIEVETGNMNPVINW